MIKINNDGDPTPDEDSIPTISSTIPENNNNNVARNQKVVITFSEEMDPSTHQ